jgi:hypothetical protein
MSVAYISAPPGGRSRCLSSRNRYTTLFVTTAQVLLLRGGGQVLGVRDWQSVLCQLCHCVQSIRVPTYEPVRDDSPDPIRVGPTYEVGSALYIRIYTYETLLRTSS